jgi:hypothetical protein
VDWPIRKAKRECLGLFGNDGLSTVSLWL